MAAAKYSESGDLRRRVSLQSVTRTPDAYGVRTDAWTTYASVWAKITTVSGREKQAHQSIVESRNVLIEIRYMAGISVSDRVQYGSRYFLINDVSDVAELHRKIALQCTEVVNG